MSRGRRKMKLRTRRARRRRSQPFARRWRRFVVALSLIVQLFAAVTPPPVAAPAFAGADEATIAAELKALFGDAADLCAHINDQGAP